MQPALVIKNDAQLLKARGLQTSQLQAKSSARQPFRNATHQAIGEHSTNLGFKKGLGIPSDRLGHRWLAQ